MQRWVGRAEDALPLLPSASFDLIVTSPPAYPSMRQEAWALGTEASASVYVRHFGRVLWSLRRVLRVSGVLCLVIEEQAGNPVLRPLAAVFKRQHWLLLSTFHWSHGDGAASWVVFLSKAPAGRLNRDAPAWRMQEWAFPRPPADAAYGFYEWPQGLVDAIVDVALPKGGSVLDPFGGKAVALSRLPARYDVVVMDVMQIDDDTGTSASEARVAALENLGRGGSESAHADVAGGA